MLNKNRIIAIAIIVLIMGTCLILNIPVSEEPEEVKTTTTTQTTTQFTTTEIVQTQTTTLKKNKKKKTKKTTKKKTTKKKSSAKHTKAECKAFAHNEVINRYHWSEKDWEALDKLWNKESGWNYNDTYGSCYGIPQSCPGSKMKSAGSDWKTNCYTQINWGLSYISARYGNPSNAWKHSKKTGWY